MNHRRLPKITREVANFIEGMIVFILEDVSILADTIGKKIDAINTEIRVLKRAIGSVTPKERLV